MKKVIISILSLLLLSVAIAQPKPKPKQPPQSEMDKAMAEAMKDMSPEEQAEMKKMMKNIMPALNEVSGRMADYPVFTSNKELVPKKDVSRIALIPKKKITQADISSYAGNLYTKIMTKGEAAEIALVKSILPKAPKANLLGNASVLAMMQGHPQAAMALSMKAVQMEPSNVNLQNNMAALLTQYGYPEQAIPVLEKLKNEFPYNSTVLNNIGQAWFSLGNLDSAKRYFTFAYRINPYHPEAKLCGGIIDEVKGDPVKAEKEYIEAMENSPNPLIDKILKNKTGEKGFEKIDFEKLKRSITIYEYFPKDWIKVHALSDNVSGYENDMRIKNGYAKMFTGLKDKIETATEAANQEADNLMNKGEDEFVKEMAIANIQGINKMSLTAVTVQKILQIYLAQWMQDNTNDYIVFKKKIDAKRAEMTRSGKNDKCPDYDRKNNEFLAYANPLIRKFHSEKIEVFRNWLNAFCTWIWYITGNPKNTVMAMCIGWTGALEELYENAVNDQEAIAKTCVKQNGDGSSFVPTPEIPNFSCPTLVKVPIGSDWHELNKGLKNFDANSLNVKNNPAKATPNQTLAYGGGSKTIAQPGKTPFVQTANGSITTGMINDTDDELVPLPKLPKDDDLVPLPKIPMEELTPLPDLGKSKFLKELLKKMMTADCKNIKSPKDQLKEQLDRMMKGVKELDDYDRMKEQIKKMNEMAEEMETTAEKKDLLKKQIEKMKQETDKMDKYDLLKESIQKMKQLSDEMDKMDEQKAFKKSLDKMKQMADDMENTPAVLKDIQQNGLQPSISSGVQAPNTFVPVKGLFN